MEPEAPQAPETGHGDGTPSNEWLGSLPDELTFERRREDGTVESVPLREHPKLKGFKSPAELARAWHSQEQVIGKKAVGLVKPPDDAPEAEKAAFRAELRKLSGVPEKAEDYAFDPPEGVSAEDPLIGWWRTVAHTHGIPPEAVKAIVASFDADFRKPYWEKAMAEAQEADKARARAATEAIEKAYGKERAAEACETAARGFKAVAEKAGIPAEEAEAFAREVGNDPRFVRVMEFVGRRFKEGRFVEGGAGAASQEQAMSTADYLNEVWGAKEKGG